MGNYQKIEYNGKKHKKLGWPERIYENGCLFYFGNDIDIAWGNKVSGENMSFNTNYGEKVKYEDILIEEVEWLLSELERQTGLFCGANLEKNYKKGLIYGIAVAKSIIGRRLNQLHKPNKEELKIADNRWKRAEKKLEKYAEF